MRRMTVLLLMGMWLAVVVFCPGSVPAEEVLAPPFDGYVTRVVGTIQEKGPNTITVYDETDKASRRLVYVLDSGWLHVGDRVVVHYRRRDNVVERIKKMRSPEYREGEQNLGYTQKGQK